MSDCIMELKNIGKTFSGVNVLRNINMKLNKGEVHALLGENGAGKSTLIKILSGYHKPDSGGEIKINGNSIQFNSPRDSIDASIRTIYQELMVCPLMTVAENIVIDKQSTFKGFIQDKKSYRKIALEALHLLDQYNIDPDQLLKDLSIAQQQIVEIARAIVSNVKIILMDEPTSSISQQDTDTLLEVVKKLRDKGVTIIYISHRLQEIAQIADRITVLRDGNLVDTVDSNTVNEQELISMMVGREFKNVYKKNKVELGQTVLQVEDLASEGTFKDVSFDVKEGEILGIGGLVGSKRTEVLEALFGYRPIHRGKIYLNGKMFMPKNPRDSIKNKIAFITEDRKKTGLVLCLPVVENISMVSVQRKTPLGYLNWKKIKKTSKKHQSALNIKINSMDQTTSTLSGGNQQKVVLGKWMDFTPSLVLFDEPTRGIDIGTKAEIYSTIGGLAANGVAVIMVSSELPELLSVTDRILVMHEGVMKGILETKDSTQESIMSLATLNNNKRVC